MFRKILGALGVGLAAGGAAAAPSFYTPYAQGQVNQIYNLLFCDDPALYATDPATANTPLWRTLRGEPLDVPGLRRIAEDAGNEGRVRALAYHRLRSAGERVAPRHLLGVIVEVPMPGGLDVLAAFSDGGVRYLNHSGKMVFVDAAGSPLQAMAAQLLSSADPVVARLGPWDKGRLPPPAGGNVRISFIVSDGLYFGEGPFEAMQRDPLAGALIEQASRLLQKVVEVGQR
jgi:hypothetical protein